MVYIQKKFVDGIGGVKRGTACSDEVKILFE
jgi:hypothetical protein